MSKGRGERGAPPATGGSIAILEARPIELSGFRLTSTGAVAIGKPSPSDWAADYAFVTAVEKASPYWVGDLLAYASERKEFAAVLDQVLETTGMARQSAINLTYISKHVAPATRELSPSISHSAQVAPLHPEEQREFLEQATTEGWGVRDLQREIRASKRKRILEGQAVVEGQYRVIYAAPQWSKVSIEELCKMPVGALAQANAVLFLWVPAHLVMANPGPRDVLDAWGFTFKSSGVWDRVSGSFGHYLEIVHEVLAIAVRGECMPDTPTPQPKSIIRARRVIDVINKPEVVRKEWIEKLYRKGPYLELFGNEKTKGWTTFGDDPRAWSTGKEIAK